MHYRNLYLYLFTSIKAAGLPGVTHASMFRGSISRPSQPIRPPPPANPEKPTLHTLNARQVANTAG